MSDKKSHDQQSNRDVRSSVGPLSPRGPQTQPVRRGHLNPWPRGRRQRRAEQRKDPGNLVHAAVEFREEQRTKRISLILSVTLATVAALILTFAPEGRQVLGSVLGIAFLVASIGLAGYKRVWFITDDSEDDAFEKNAEADDYYGEYPRQ